MAEDLDRKKEPATAVNPSSVVSGDAAAGDDAVQVRMKVKIEMLWEKKDFSRAHLDEKLPIVLAPDEVQRFLDHSPASNTAPYC